MKTTEETRQKLRNDFAEPPGPMHWALGADRVIPLLDDIDEVRGQAVEIMQEAEKWRVLNQRRLVALESVEWIMVNGRVQCPSCLESKDAGHSVLCLLDEALRPTAEKLKLREEQNAMYADCSLGTKP